MLVNYEEYLPCRCYFYKLPLFIECFISKVDCPDHIPVIVVEGNIDVSQRICMKSGDDCSACANLNVLTIDGENTRKKIVVVRPKPFHSAFISCVYHEPSDDLDYGTQEGVISLIPREYQIVTAVIQDIESI